MRRALLAGICILLAASVALAGGTPDIDDESAQMVFEFNGLGALDLDTYAGGIGLRYFIDDEGLAGRFSLNAAYRTDEEDDLKDTFSLIGGSIILEKFLEPISSVAPYVGIGFGYYYSTLTEPTEEDGDRKTKISTLQVPAVAGFQWWFGNAVAIGGEYGLALGYVTEKDTLDGLAIGDREKFKVGFYAASIFLTVALR